MFVCKERHNNNTSSTTRNAEHRESAEREGEDRTKVIAKAARGTQEDVAGASHAKDGVDMYDIQMANLAQDHIKSKADANASRPKPKKRARHNLLVFL